MTDETKSVWSDVKGAWVFAYDWLAGLLAKYPRFTLALVLVLVVLAAVF